MESRNSCSQKLNQVMINNWRYPFSCAQLDQLYWSFCGFLNAKGGQVMIKDVGLDAYQKDEFERELGYSLCGFIPCLKESNTKKYISVEFKKVSSDEGKYDILICVKGGDPRKYYTRTMQPYTNILVHIRSGAQVIGGYYGLEKLQRRENCQIVMKRSPAGIEEKKFAEDEDKKFSKSNKKQHQTEVKNLAKEVKEKNERLKKLIGLVGNQSSQKVSELTEILHMLHRIQELSIDLNHHYQKRSLSTCYKGLDNLA